MSDGDEDAGSRFAAALMAVTTIAGLFTILFALGFLIVAIQGLPA